MQEIYTSARSRTASVPVALDFESKRSTIENLIAWMPGRICLTLDVWNSNNTTGYVFITGQFIDSDWNIHKRLPSVVMELFTQETLQVCQEMVKKVTDCVKYVKASEALEEYFPHLKQLQVLNTKNLSLDDQTKLNTTYEMLLLALELKKEFSRLDTLYPDYFKSPSGEDWDLVDNLCTYLKLIFDTAMDEGIHQLFLDYVAGDVTGHLSNGDGHGLGLTDINDFIMESASQQSKSELDQYLEESLLPRSHEFDEMNRYRCTLKPETVEKEKHLLWDYLEREIKRWDGEVVTMGDFNELRHKCERLGSVFNASKANVFNSFIVGSGLAEVVLGGSKFTWCHKSGSKMSKLDRFLISDNLMYTYPNSNAITLPRAYGRGIKVRSLIPSDFL
nr:hypothetical protein [Tanacetum cinerariifolium]